MRRKNTGVIRPGAFPLLLELQCMVSVLNAQFLLSLDCLRTERLEQHYLERSTATNLNWESISQIQFLFEFLLYFRFFLISELKTFDFRWSYIQFPKTQLLNELHSVCFELKLIRVNVYSNFYLRNKKIAFTLNPNKNRLLSWGTYTTDELGGK